MECALLLWARSAGMRCTLCGHNYPVCMVAVANDVFQSEVCVDFLCVSFSPRGQLSSEWRWKWGGILRVFTLKVKIHKRYFIPLDCVMDYKSSSSLARGGAPVSGIESLLSLCASISSTSMLNREMYRCHGCLDKVRRVLRPCAEVLDPPMIGHHTIPNLRVHIKIKIAIKGCRYSKSNPHHI